MMDAVEKRATLLDLIAELEDVATAIGLVVEMCADELTEARLDALLAGVSAALGHLNALQAPPPAADAP
jgi:hypothetical protein